MAIMTNLRVYPAVSVTGDKDDPSATATNGASTWLSYVQKELKIFKDAMESNRRSELNDLIGKRKLFLVLDLDHTLLHNISVKKLSPIEKHLLNNTDYNDETLIRSESSLTKLRPFVRTFLEEASKLFKLCVYTMGKRSQADKLVRILDPERKYFDSRVISREDCTMEGKKGLDVVMAPESAVVIVDDTESVWEKHTSNLVQLNGYHYFAGADKGSLTRITAPSYSESLKDESEAYGELAHVLNILKFVHKTFFDDPNMRNDVRNVLRSIFQDVDATDPMNCT